MCYCVFTHLHSITVFLLCHIYVQVRMLALVLLRECCSRFVFTFECLRVCFHSLHLFTFALVHVCMLARLHLFTFALVHVCMLALVFCLHVCVFMCMSVQVFACVSKQVFMCVCLRALACKCSRACVRVHSHMCACVHVFTFVCVHVCMHTALC